MAWFHIPIRVEGFDQLLDIGERLVAQLDDLKQVMSETSDRLAGVATQVAALASEVADLIARLSTPPVDLAGAIADAQSIEDKVQAVSESLGAIPPAPVVSTSS